MWEFNKKKSYKKFIYSPFSLLLLLLLSLVLLKAVWGVYQKERVSERYLEREQEELTKAETREKELANSIDYLKTDKGIEAEIRSKFRVVKDGESVAVIVNADASSTADSTATSTPGFWQNVTRMFGL